MMRSGYLTRALVRACSGLHRNRRLLLLTYHRVSEVRDPMLPWDPDRETFRAHVEFLQDHCTLMNVSDAVSRLRAGELPPAAVCITFDDGYADNYSIAAEELQRVGASATFFVATGFLNGGAMWNDRVIESIRLVACGTLDFGEFGLIHIDDETNRADVALGLIRKLKYLAYDRREHAVDSLVQCCNVSVPNNLMMEDSMVKSLHNSGMEVGAHTVNHPILSELDDDTARIEIESSKKYLETVINSPVSSFAYPNGQPGKDFSDRDIQLVREAGFAAAVSTSWGAARSDSNRFSVPRAGVFGKTPLRLAMQTSKLFMS